MGIVKSLDHIAITVSNVEKSLPFYVDLLGFEEVGTHRLEGETISTMTGKPGVVMKVVRLRTPDDSKVLLDLQEYVTPKETSSNARLGMANHSHFAFKVKGILAIYNRLKQKGAQFVSAPVSFGVEHGEVRVVFLKDPDGSILELVEAPEE
jgi:glyoxylase I family protein